MTFQKKLTRAVSSQDNKLSSGLHPAPEEEHLLKLQMNNILERRKSQKLTDDSIEGRLVSMNSFGDIKNSAKFRSLGKSESSHKTSSRDVQMSRQLLTELGRKTNESTELNKKNNEYDNQVPFFKIHVSNGMSTSKSNSLIVPDRKEIPRVTFGPILENVDSGKADKAANALNVETKLPRFLKVTPETSAANSVVNPENLGSQIEELLTEFDKKSPEISTRKLDDALFNHSMSITSPGIVPNNSGSTNIMAVNEDSIVPTQSLPHKKNFKLNLIDFVIC